MKDYPQIAQLLNQAVSGVCYNDVPQIYQNLIKVMENHQAIISKIKCFDDVAFEIIADFMNTHPKGVDSETFIHACGLLEHGGSGET